jgi:pimeloyl-ACP methyl ester carboxylesterase
MTNKFLEVSVLAFFLLGLSACVPTPEIPMPLLEYGRIEATGNTHLLVFLRGIGGKYTDFEEYGLIDAVRARKLPVDILVPDAHYGYYKSETIALRLKQDVIDPARKRGYRQIWLAGFSMGGLGSLFYIREHPEDIDGVMLISPFMGWKAIRGEILAAGGIRSWQPERSEIDDWQFLIWSFVLRYTTNPEDYPPIYLGYGKNDSLAGPNSELLAGALETTRVFALPGDHDYPTFKAIWAEYLNRLDKEFRPEP